jgi:SAM-dependent methyltransferase
LRSTTALATELFPVRKPESSEAMTPEESAAFSSWGENPQGLAVYGALASHIVERLGLERGRIVSVGEGEGLLASLLAARLPLATIVGTDICPEVVARARARHKATNLSYEVVPVLELVGVGSADVVVCAFALHHFADPVASIANMVGLLSAGGLLYIEDLRRDATLASYSKLLKMYEGVNPTMADLFRASVNAAYTQTELDGLLSRHEGEREVGLVRFRDSARATYENVDASQRMPLPEALEIVEGVWMEGVVRRRGAAPAAAAF